jgi:hypothetical protein
MQPTRRQGRPPLDDDGDESVSVSFRVSSSQYDDLYQRAQQERLTVSEHLRRELAARAFRTQK